MEKTDSLFTYIRVIVPFSQSDLIIQITNHIVLGNNIANTESEIPNLKRIGPICGDFSLQNIRRSNSDIHPPVYRMLIAIGAKIIASGSTASSPGFSSRAKCMKRKNMAKLTIPRSPTIRLYGIRRSSHQPMT